MERRPAPSANVLVDRLRQCRAVPDAANGSSYLDFRGAMALEPTTSGENVPYGCLGKAGVHPVMRAGHG
jgi:hypothetical protein